MFPTLLGITLVVFVVMAASPGGVTSQLLVEGFGLKPQEKQALEEYYNRRYGLDQPAAIQYLRWLNNVSPVGFEISASGDVGKFSFTKGSDLGESFRYGRPVSDLLKERVPITLLLNILTIPIIYIIAILVGVRAATERGRRFDLSSSFVMLALWSVPTMLAGVLLIGFFSSQQYWHWFPTSGLSERAALDMPFMPHWENWLDISKLFFGLVLGLFAGLMLAKLPRVNLRSSIAAVAGIALGITMAYVLPGQTSLTVYLFLALFWAVVLWALAKSDYLALRLIFLGLLGLVVGGVAGQLWGEGQFVRGFLLDRGWHLVLPIICLSYGGFAFLARLTRSSMLENLLADYARTARAKGVSERDVLWKHVFRNSLLPLITVFASLLPGLLAGSVIVESIFSIDGMGKLAVDAVKGRDRELVLSITLISGFLTLMGYLLADLLYAIADPRVSYD